MVLAVLMNRRTQSGRVVRSILLAIPVCLLLTFVAKTWIVEKLLSAAGLPFGIKIDARVEKLSLSKILIANVSLKSKTLSCELTNIETAWNLLNHEDLATAIDTVDCTHQEQDSPSSPALNLADLELPPLPRFSVAVRSLKIAPFLKREVLLEIVSTMSGFVAKIQQHPHGAPLNQVTLVQDRESLLRVNLNCKDDDCAANRLNLERSGNVIGAFEISVLENLIPVDVSIRPTLDAKSTEHGEVKFSGTLLPILHFASPSAILTSINEFDLKLVHDTATTAHVTLHNGVMNFAADKPLILTVEDQWITAQNVRAALAAAPQYSFVRVGGLHGPAVERWYRGPLDIALEGLIDTEKFLGTGKVKSSDGGLTVEFPISWSHTDGAQTGPISFDVSSQATFSAKDIPILPSGWAINAPKASGTLDLGETVALILKVKSLDFRAEQVALNQLAGELALKYHDEKLDISRAELSVDKASSAVEISKIKSKFAGSIPGRIDISALSGSIFGGDIVIGPVSVPSPAAMPWTASVSFSRIDLAEIVKLYGKETIRASGRVTGSLILQMSEAGDLVVTDGKFHSESGGGWIRYQSADTQASNSAVSLVQRALEDYAFTDMSGTLALLVDGTLKVGIELQGEALQMNTTRPVNVNLSIEENLPALLKSLGAIQRSSDGYRSRQKR